jgi:3-oxoacyl-[acyl-carrier protein] reductase
VKHILVTGGSRGIGRGIVEQLMTRGYQVSFLYNSNKNMADDLTVRLARLGTIKSYQCDVREFDKVKAVVREIIEETGGLDGLVNNSGITYDKNLLMMQENDWKTVINTNLNGCFNVTRTVINHFLKKRSGKIVNITSVAGIKGMSGQTNYCSSKSGIIGFTRSLAVEVAKYGVTVNAVAPGYIDTDMTKNMPEKVREKLLSQIPVGVIGRVEDVANIVQFLLSDESNYITGQIIAVDGGITA